MASTKKQACRKTGYQKVGFDRKLSIIDEINNDLISINHASRVYKISRSSITYWMKKLSSFTQKKKGMSKNDEIKKLKERIGALEFIKELQLDIIADFEKVTGEEVSKNVHDKKTKLTTLFNHPKMDKLFQGKTATVQLLTRQEEQMIIK